MYKNFYLNVDGDKVLLTKIDLLNENEVIVPHYAELYSALSNNPKVISIDTLGYIPRKGSVWNGVDFDSEKDRPLPNTSDNSLKHFSFLVDGKHAAYYGLSNVINVNRMIVAALSSDPTISEELIDE